jgi:hypothetical protein
VTGDGAADTEKGSVTQNRKALFLGNWAAAWRSPQASIPIRQGFPADFFRIRFVQQVGAFEQHAF